MKPLIVVVALAIILLTGCKTLENRIVRTLQCDRAYVVSNWGPVSFGTELSQADAQELARLSCE